MIKGSIPIDTPNPNATICDQEARLEFLYSTNSNPTKNNRGTVSIAKRASPPLK